MSAWLDSPFAGMGVWLMLSMVPFILLTALVSWAATWAVLRLLIVWRVFDEPNHRSSHSRPTPRGGGLAVVPVVLIAWIAGDVATQTTTLAVWHVIAGAALLAVVSWIDDLRSLPASLRFGVQVAAVVLGLWTLAPDALVFQGLLPLPLDRVATALLWLWFVNLFNFMDGIDGITAVETASIAGGLALIHVLLGMPVPTIFREAAVAAAALGFLYWNWAPSRIFLGDVGSVPLGYLLGGLLIDAANAGYWAVAVILPLYYLADASLTLGRRLLRGAAPWRAHREHFYQRAVQRGFGHAGVVRRILACNIVLFVLAVPAANAPDGLTPWISIVFAALAVAALLFILARQAAPRAPQDPGSRP
ncbi:MAG: glycosyltransferase family 4 protein [Kiloniellaceae bacterium]